MWMAENAVCSMIDSLFANSMKWLPDDEYGWEDEH